MVATIDWCFGGFIIVIVLYNHWGHMKIETSDIIKVEIEYSFKEGLASVFDYIEERYPNRHYKILRSGPIGNGTPGGLVIS